MLEADYRNLLRMERHDPRRIINTIAEGSLYKIPIIPLRGQTHFGCPNGMHAPLSSLLTSATVTNHTLLRQTVI